jgi:hypothetical protein
VSNKQLAIVAGAVAAVLGIIILLLITGGPPAGELAKDPTGDVVVSEGETRPSTTALADIRSARVYLEASQIVFEVQADHEIPKNLKDETMSWRWEILEGGSETWIVSANISVGRPIASITAAQRNYGASTIDDTLPGIIDWTGDKLFVRLNAPEIEGFPTDFTWRLESSLDGDRADPGSAVASDTAPDSGLGEYPPP